MKKVAIFDFDGTLIKGDSLWPFLIYASSAVAVLAAVIEGLARFAVMRAMKRTAESRRTFVKGFLLRRILKGKKRETLKDAAFKVFMWREINEPIMQKLQEHHLKGDILLIASGSLDLYLPELVRDIPHNALICTEVGVENGIVTGEMIKGNCVRKGKAARVKAWMDEHGPFEDSFGYGNAPHDLAMLDLVKHRVVVG